MHPVQSKTKWIRELLARTPTRRFLTGGYGRIGPRFKKQDTTGPSGSNPEWSEKAEEQYQENYRKSEGESQSRSGFLAEKLTIRGAGPSRVQPSGLGPQNQV